MERKKIELFSTSNLDSYNVPGGINNNIVNLTINETSALRFLLRELKDEVNQGKKGYLLSVKEIDECLVKLKNVVLYEPA
jgi:hypothetical protein